jgi:hypothetical protein
MIDIKSYAKPKTSTTGVSGGSGGNIINNNPIDIQNTDSTLNISRNDDTFIIDSNTFKLVNNKLVYTGTVDINNLIATSVTSGTGNISNLISNTGNITNLTSDDATIETLSGTTLNYTDGTFETLEVTKAAHFWQLIIDEIKSTQGQVIITAANAKFDKVVKRESDGDYLCYWKATDGEKRIYNQFAEDDLIVCQTFNLDDTTQTNQTNKFYWWRVWKVGEETIDGELYNKIHLYGNDYDTNSNGVPAVGDEVVQLGNKSDSTRQAAIVISAYNNQFLDSAIQAPSIVQYNGINDYNLSTHRLNVISKGLNQFKGNFQTTAGDIQTQINNNKKTYFPILKPWYDYQNNLITDYKNDPLRYKGDLDIYSTPTFLEPGTYKVRVFVNSSALGSSYAICYHGNQYPNDLGSYDPIQGFTLSSTGKYIAAIDGTTLYEFTGEVTISENGYYGFNWWETLYMYVAEESNEFESNYSRITQTNNRITSEVGNINGQISTINQTAEDIQLQVNETSIRLNDGDITLTGNTKVQGDLTISDATNGFTITNESNYNTVIKPQSIGNYGDYATREITRQELNYSATNELVTGNIKSKEQHPADTEYFEVRFNNNPDNHTIYLESGTLLNLNSFNRFGMNILNTYSYTHRIYGKLDYYGITVNEGGYTPSTQNYDSRVYLYGYKQYGSETVNVELISVHIYSIQTRISVLDANNNEVGYVVLNGNTPTLNYNYTATTTGNYKIKTSSLIRFNSIYNYTGERADNVFTNYMRTVFFMNIKTSLSSNQIENIIGYDGIALSLGANKTVFMGKDHTVISYGNNKLNINDTGIYKYAGSTTPQYQSESVMGTETGLSAYVSEYVKINGCVTRVLTQSGTFYLQPRDEIISYRGTSNDSYLWIGRPNQEVGRKIYVKPTGNRTNIYIGTYSSDTGKYFMESNGRGTHTNVEIGDRGITLISDGSYWWMYYPY